jgi:hypothetical protein
MVYIPSSTTTVTFGLYGLYLDADIVCPAIIGDFAVTGLTLKDVSTIGHTGATFTGDPSDGVGAITGAVLIGPCPGSCYVVAVDGLSTTEHGATNSQTQAQGATCSVSSTGIPTSCALNQTCLSTGIGIGTGSSPCTGSGYMNTALSVVATKRCTGTVVTPTMSGGKVTALTLTTAGTCWNTGSAYTVGVDLNDVVPGRFGVYMAAGNSTMKDVDVSFSGTQASIDDLEGNVWIHPHAIQSVIGFEDDGVDTVLQGYEGDNTFGACYEATHGGSNSELDSPRCYNNLGGYNAGFIGYYSSQSSGMNVSIEDPQWPTTYTATADTDYASPNGTMNLQNTTQVFNVLHDAVGFETGRRVWDRTVNQTLLGCTSGAWDVPCARSYTGLSADNSGGTAINAPAPANGWYLVTCELEVTTAGTGSDVLPGCYFNWASGVDGVSRVSAKTPTVATPATSVSESITQLIYLESGQYVFVKTLGGTYATLRYALNMNMVNAQGAWQH